MFLHIFQVIFFLPVFVFNFEPFTPIFIRSQQFSVWTICSLFGHLQYIALPGNIDLQCQRQHFVKEKSTSFLNSETKVDLLRVTKIKFLYKTTCHLHIKIYRVLCSFLNYCLPCFISDVLVPKGFTYLFPKLIT